jgi:hypothetical protein
VGDLFTVFDPWDHVAVTITDDEVRVEGAADDPEAARSVNMIAVWLVDDLRHRMGSWSR